MSGVEEVSGTADRNAPAGRSQKGHGLYAHEPSAVPMLARLIDSACQGASDIAAVALLALTLYVYWQLAGGSLASSTPNRMVVPPAMFVLESAECINVRDLATALSSTPPSVSRLCDRLQAVGFLVRESSPASRREVELRLSERGHAYLRELRERRQAHLREVIDALPATTRLQLMTDLPRLRDAAVNHNRPPAARNESDTRSA